MNTWQNAVITNKGLALQAKLLAGTTLDITRAVTGSGYVTPGLLQQQTAVTSPQQTMSFRPVTYPANGEACVPCYIENDGLSTGYTAMQVGIYATDPDEGEILFFIAQAQSGSGTVVPSESESPGYSAEWNFYFQYGQADSVTVTVDPSNTVSHDEFVSTAYFLQGGTAIPSGADLDDYTTPGNYYCQTNAIAATLDNCPTSGMAFTMKVEYSQGTGYYSQTIKEYDSGTIYYRYYNNSVISPWGVVAAAPEWTAENSLSTYKRIYIDPNGDDNNTGTSTAPMATIIGALRKYAQSCKWLDIYMNDGTYTQEIGTIAFDACDVAIRSTSQNKESVTLNITQQIDVMIGSVRIYNVTINMTAGNTRAISVDNGRLFCYQVRVNVPTDSTASCVNVYNGAMAWLYYCVLNSGTGSNAGACAYGNQAMLIKALNCTTERTVAFGFFATNGSTIEYTATVTAETMTKETNLGRCYVPVIFLPITGGTLTGNLTIDPSVASPPALTLTSVENSNDDTASTRISKNATASSDLGTYIRDYAYGGTDSGNYAQLQIRKSSPSLGTRLQLIDVVNGSATAYNVYGDFNKQVVDATTEADS